MEAIKNTVGSVLRELAAKKKQSAKDDLSPLLKKIFTKKESAHIKFNYYRKGIVGLSADSSSRIYSLNLQKEKLLVKLRGKIPGIKDIRFYLGETK